MSRDFSCTVDCTLQFSFKSAKCGTEDQDMMTAYLDNTVIASTSGTDYGVPFEDEDISTRFGAQCTEGKQNSRTTWDETTQLINISNITAYTTFSLGFEISTSTENDLWIIYETQLLCHEEDVESDLNEVKTSIATDDNESTDTNANIDTGSVSDSDTDTATDSNTDTDDENGTGTPRDADGGDLALIAGTSVAILICIAIAIATICGIRSYHEKHSKFKEAASMINVLEVSVDNATPMGGDTSPNAEVALPSTTAGSSSSTLGRIGRLDTASLAVPAHMQSTSREGGEMQREGIMRMSSATSNDHASSFGYDAFAAEFDDPNIDDLYNSKLRLTEVTEPDPTETLRGENTITR